MPKVASLIDEGTRGSTICAHPRTAASARESLLQAGATITEFGNVDRRARDYVGSGQQLMAGDVVFAEGGETAAQAGQLIEAARLGESLAFDESEAGRRRQQAYALGGAAAAGGIVIVILALVVPQRERGIAEVSPGTSPVAGGELMLRGDPLRKAETSGKEARQSGAGAESSRSALHGARSRERSRGLEEAARPRRRCARRQRPDHLDWQSRRRRLAAGSRPWLLAANAGADGPCAALGRQCRGCGLPDKRASDCPRPTWRLERRVWRPLLSPDGCIGALTAEINDRGETSDAVQALAEIFAAQLASVLAASSSSPAANAGQEQIAI